MGPVAPTHRWRLPRRVSPTLDFTAAATARGLSTRMVALLATRGHRAPADLAAFFDAPEAGLHDPSLLPDAAAFRERLWAARRNGEPVLVFGDFDADGLTGLAILTLALRRLGVQATPYVPDRLVEGHGLSLAALEQARASGCGLIVTVDTGTTSVDEVEAARAAGIDVLVSDHHHVPERLPATVALVNPHRPDSHYPDSGLAGTGVAFKLAQLLLADEPDGPAEALRFADLATIGTVADVAPIVGENRAIARLGLAELRLARRPGIAALLEAARIQPARLDLDTIAFQLAPRLNAGGRMGDAMLGARLLLAGDPDEAAGLAAQLETANLARREATATVLAEARAAAVAAGDRAAVVVSGDWPVGIIGLAAGRLAEELGRPAFVFAVGPARWRGSARGPEGSDLASALDACADLLERYGGHPQAAGCEVAPARFPALRDRLLERFELAANASPERFDRRPVLDLDLALAAAEVDYQLLRELAILEPTGPGNAPVLLGIADLAVVRARRTAGDHASFTLRKGLEVLDAIAFDRGELADQLSPEDRIDVVARLASRSFGGYESLQLEIRDVAPTGYLAALASTAPSLAAVP